MKTSSTTAIVQVKAEELKAYSPVNETLAADLSLYQFSSIPNKTFGSLDLWKCRKQKRLNGITIR